MKAARTFAADADPRRRFEDDDEPVSPGASASSAKGASPSDPDDVLRAWYGAIACTVHEWHCTTKITAQQR
jgi:hypothetical protein